MGPRVSLDGRKIPSPSGFDPGPSSPWSVAIPTELPGPHITLLLLYIQRQGRQVSSNKAFRRVDIATVSVETQQVLHILTYVNSLSYPACKLHSPYCHLWPVCLYHIFPYSLTNGKIFEKKKSH